MERILINDGWDHRGPQVCGRRTHTLILRFIFSFNKSIHKTTKSTTLNLVGWIRVSSGCCTNLCDITHTVGIGDDATGGL